MAPRRKPVVDPRQIVQNWHLRPQAGRRRPRKGWADKVVTEESTTAEAPPRAWEKGKRAFPPLSLIYDELPAYAVGPPPERPKL